MFHVVFYWGDPSDAHASVGWRTDDPNIDPMQTSLTYRHWFYQYGPHTHATVAPYSEEERMRRFR